MNVKHAAAIAVGLCCLGLAWTGLGTDRPPTVEGIRSHDGGTAFRSPHGTHGRISSRPRREIRQERHVRQVAIHACCPADVRALDGNPAKVAAMTGSMSPGMLRDRLLQQAVRAWAANSADEARRWVGRLTDVPERQQLLVAIDEELNRDHPGEAHNLPLVDQLIQTVNQSAWDDSKLIQVQHLTEKWAGENLDAASDWVLGQPEGNIRDALVHRIAMVQVANDPAEAARLVAEEIPAGPEQDEAVMSVVHRWALQSPSAAAKWVAAFPEGPLKSRALQELQGLAAYQVGIRAPTPDR